uniref:Uncharacterized protein n=1 Tax=Leclercia adecarboxylata TaxID=83655 RepID=A0A7D5KGE9_9ENTR|nr:hypothetical protein [Leclercia adecarboxylata]
MAGIIPAILFPSCRHKQVLNLTVPELHLPELSHHFPW